MKILTKYLPAIFLTAFGLLTLFLSTTIILDIVGMRKKQGDYVLFVIWVNFFCGIAYLITAYGFLKQKYWVFKILSFVVIALIITFISFYFYVENGGIHKKDTFGALTFRTLVTILFALIAKFAIKMNTKKINIK